MARLADVANPQDLALLYFSGHGSRRDLSKKADGAQELVIVLYDFDNKGRGEISHAGLVKAFEAVKAEQKVIILDF